MKVKPQSFAEKKKKKALVLPVRAAHTHTAAASSHAGLSCRWREGRTCPSATGADETASPPYAKVGSSPGPPRSTHNRPRRRARVQPDNRGRRDRTTETQNNTHTDLQFRDLQPHRSIHPKPLPQSRTTRRTPYLTSHFPYDPCKNYFFASRRVVSIP